VPAERRSIIHLQPPVNHETPEPEKRVGFLTRVNPKATVRSVIRSACITCVVAAALWGLCLIFRPNPNWQPSWIAFVGWMFCAALVGAVWEWQVPDPDQDEHPPSSESGG
jgi:hypothetical protein